MPVEIATTPAAYVGNGHYCYANVTAMLLAAAGEQIGPALVEPLTGLALGAAWIDEPELIFFNSSAPDEGVSRALRLLGFDVTERASDDDPPPFDELRAALQHGPAILGPVDMGMLVYQPGRGRPNGVDHFVLAYAMTDGEVFLHDPAGYPCVSLRLDDLAVAWKAERIGYRRGAYRWWTAPRRAELLSEDALFERAMREFAAIYRDAEVPRPRVTAIGSAAILRLAQMVRSGELTPMLAGHLRGFAFPVGARRALDFAAFFRGRRPELTTLKIEQAEMFGRAQSQFTRESWEGTADALTELARAENRIRDLIVGTSATS